jgi:hypothetical protein
MLHNSFSGSAGTIYIDNVYFNKVAIVAPAAAHMHLLHSKQENMDQLGFDFF